MPKGFWVKVKPQADFYGTATWKQVSNIWVKTTTTAWQSVSDMWVKVKPASDAYGTATWKAMYSAGTAPDTPIQILTSYTSTELLRVQGRNYHWTPTPTTLQYKFVSVDTQDSMISDITDWVTTDNPTTSSTLPGASTYVTIPNDAPYIYAGTTNRIQFIVKGTTSSGLTFTFKDEFSLVLPKAPTVTATPISATQVRLNITRNSADASGVANRYIVYLWDGTNYRYAGNTVGITGLGGYGVSETGNEITIGGLSPSIEYSFIVTPITGTAGSTMSNYYGYAGLEGTADSATISPYTFTFGKTLHVGTNGYIGLDAGATSDSITSTGTGRFVGIFPADLSQLSTTSLWYWSDTSKFIIRWEGTTYGQASQTRTYQITFYKDQSYSTVYMIDVTGGSPGNQAMVKDNTVQTTYPSTPATGSAYNVYFDGTTTPVVFLGASVQPKATMVQVAGLTSGSLDQGYTSIVTSTNQNVTPTLGAFDITSFTKGTVSSSSQGASRSTTLTWGVSDNATAYQIQYQGSNDDVNWTTVQAYSVANNISGTTDTKTWSTSGGNFGYYTFMRANIRSWESTGTATYVYSNGGSYVNATGTAPGQPTFGTITKTDTTASIPFTVGSDGSNYLTSSIEYQYRSSGGSYPGTWLTSVISNGAGTISLSSLSASTTYYIKIRTKNLDNLYSPENETNFTTGAAVTTPNSLTATTNDSAKITLSWSGGAADDYLIYWLTSTSAWPQAAFTGSDFTDTSSPYEWGNGTPTSPTRGTDYYFFIRARSGTSPNYSYGSNWYPAQTTGIKGRAPLYAPGTPTDLATTLVSSSRIDISWTAPSTSSTQDSASGYDIYYSISSSAPSSNTAATTTSTTTTKSITSLSQDTTYYFWVRATNSDNKSGWTSVLQVKTRLTTPTLSHTKRYVYNSDLSNSLTRITSSTKRQDWTYSARVWYDLSWSGNTSATSYDIYFMDNTSSPPIDSDAADYTSTSASYSDYWDQSNRSTVTYYYWVRARNSTNTSAWSSFTGGASTATVVSGLSVTLVNNSSGATASASPGNSALTYTWSGVSTTALHYSRISATIAGTSSGTVRSPGAV